MHWLSEHRMISLNRHDRSLGAGCEESAPYRGWPASVAAARSLHQRMRHMACPGLLANFVTVGRRKSARRSAPANSSVEPIHPVDDVPLRLAVPAATSHRPSPSDVKYRHPARQPCHTTLRYSTGSDLVVVPGEELAARMEAYWWFRMHELRDAEGRSAADHIKERYGTAAQVPDVGLPADLSEAGTVGVVYDEVEGNYFWADFGLLQETFADPALAARRWHREAVLGTWRSRAFRRWRCVGWPSRILSGRAGCSAGAETARILVGAGRRGAVAAVQGELVRAAGSAQCHADQPGVVRPLPARSPAEQRREARLTGGRNGIGA
jgi:hypothetical protein